MVFQWFPMVANHWSDDGMVTIHRSGLCVYLNVGIKGIQVTGGPSMDQNQFWGSEGLARTGRQFRQCQGKTDKCWAGKDE